MRLYIDRRVFFGFMTSLFILLLLGYLSYRNNQRFVEQRHWVYHTTEVLDHIERTNTNVVRLEELLGMYVISGDTSYLKLYNNELQQGVEHYRKLFELTADNSRQQAIIDSIRLAGRKKLTIHRAIVNARKQSQATSDSLIQTADNRRSFDRLMQLLAHLQQAENMLLENRLQVSESISRNFQITFLILMATIIALLTTVFVIINRNFRARMRAEARTNQLNQELEAFTYSVSHDLRSPLRSIRGFTEVLRDEYGNQLDDEGRRLLGIVMRNASQMGQLIDDLLDFSRIGRKELMPTRINVQVLVSEIIHDVTENGQAARVTWDVKPLEDMHGDSNMIKQVWINLLSNAVKYSHKASSPRVEVGCREEQGHVVYYVRDNGVGFDMQYQDKLFKVFQRLHGKEFEGTGVGLALVHRIITRHRGKIWAESTPNEGAVFYFYTQL